MSAFVQQYVDTALADPAAAWDLLTPRFQQDCCTSEGSYAGYWNTIETASLRDSLKVYVMGSTLSSLSLLTPQPFPSAATTLGDALFMAPAEPTQ